jgi:glycosyltransferase involved in cell wall biosynthesis
MYIYRLAHALGDHGNHVDVVHCIDAYHLQHPGEPEIKFAEHPNVHRYGIESGWGWLSPFLTHQTGRPMFKVGTIKRLMAQNKYDVIHYHNISLLGPHILRLEGMTKPAVKVYTTHEHWLICPNHVLWKFDRRACEKPDCLMCVIRAKRPPQLWRYTGMLEKESQAVDRFLSPSRFTARMHAERGFPHPITHLPYFIDRADEDWREPGSRPHPRPYYLFVGRLEKIKGADKLIEVWKRIEGVDLVLAGSGGQAAELKKKAAGNERVIFVGAQNPKALGNYYYHALATIVPSLTYETFGMIILESFARKTPVIVRDLGALPEVVQESGGGLIFNSEEELVNRVREISASPFLRSRLGENGYTTFLSKWTREAHLQQYFELLDQIAMDKFHQIPWEGR